MKKTRLITALLSAATVASMLSATASADWATDYKNSANAIIDVKSTVEGEIKTVSEGIGGLNGDFFVDSTGEAITGKKLVYTDVSGEYDVGFKMRMLKLDKKTGRVTERFTGFAKNKTGRRYYSEGRRIYGWYKIGDYWYHFDENGYADTGKTKICGGYYTFDKKGRWTGKISKSAAAPKNFSLEFLFDETNGFDTDGKLLYGRSSSGMNQTAKEKFSARDRQVMYCMFLESGITAGKDYDSDSGNSFGSSGALSGLYIENVPEQGEYVIKVRIGAKVSEITYSTDDEGNAYFDEDCFGAYTLSENLHDYMINCLFRKFPRR